MQISDHLRRISFAVSAKDLIERIYTATDIKNKVLFLSDGKNRVANLHRLLQLAEDFSGAGTQLRAARASRTISLSSMWYLVVPMIW